jgi:N-acetylmuramoyl-L-alanine amidase
MDTRTEAQKEAMVRVIRDLLKRYPNAKVVGHRDMPGAATQCPGFDAAAWWAEVNKKPKGLLALLLAIFGGNK